MFGNLGLQHKKLLTAYKRSTSFIKTLMRALAKRGIKIT